MDIGQAGSSATVVNEVPETLKRLVLILAKVFYGPQHHVLMDYLQRNICMKEDRLRDLLKLEIKELRKLLVDKFIAERLVAEENAEGRSRKTNYYHVNYKGIVNVTKYKIDHIRQKLETREQDNSRKASYICTGCRKTYDALDVGTIFNFELQQMICWNCNQKVEDDKTSGPTQETRNLLAKFNDDMAGIFSMLQQVDGIRFARHIMEPPIVKHVETPEESKDAAQVLRLGEHKFNVQEKGRSELYSKDITVSIGEAVEEQVEAKAAVPWLQHNAYDYENQPTVSFTNLGASTQQNGKHLNGHLNEPMEVDDAEDHIGFSLELLFNVSKNMDIGQLLFDLEGVNTSLSTATDIAYK